MFGGYSAVCHGNAGAGWTGGGAEQTVTRNTYGANSDVHQTVWHLLRQAGSLIHSHLRLGVTYTYTYTHTHTHTHTNSLTLTHSLSFSLSLSIYLFTYM